MITSSLLVMYLVLPNIQPASCAARIEILLRLFAYIEEWRAVASLVPPARLPSIGSGLLGDSGVKPIHPSDVIVHLEMIAFPLSHSSADFAPKSFPLSKACPKCLECLSSVDTWEVASVCLNCFLVVPAGIVKTDDNFCERRLGVLSCDGFSSECSVQW
ncbi:hypothetical protein QBC35DRAFT_149005 [Podospora australis]|uniref:Uncharacterized protein n=1 Tax=Podospora australis TaxID=1536484 RepID=A0AAN7AKY7_9PEZI|nr:hypothetical protein QBC35DRAFT_149005 [Podospora australis]